MENLQCRANERLIDLIDDDYSAVPDPTNKNCYLVSYKGNIVYKLLKLDYNKYVYEYIYSLGDAITRIIPSPFTFTCFKDLVAHLILLRDKYKKSNKVA